MTDNQPLENARSAIAAYRAQLDLIATTELGRPEAVRRGLNFLAAGAVTALTQAGGKTVAVTAPDFDAIVDDHHDHDGHPRPKPGRVTPAKNRKFLRRHRSNLDRLDKELAKVSAKAKSG